MSAWSLKQRHIVDIRNGKYDKLEKILSNVMKLGETDVVVRETLFIELLHILSLSDSVNPQNGSVTPQSKLSLQIFHKLLCTTNPLLHDWQKLVRSMEVSELRSVQLDRFLNANVSHGISVKARDVLFQFGVVLRCVPSTFCAHRENEALDTQFNRWLTTHRVPFQAVRSHSHSSAQDTGGLRRGRSANTSPPRGRPSSQQPPPAGSVPTVVAPQGRSQAERERDYRALPAEPSVKLSPCNPVYNPNLTSVLLKPMTPDPIAKFAKFFGVNCIPRFPVHRDPTPLHTATTPQSQSEAATLRGGPRLPVIITDNAATTIIMSPSSGGAAADGLPPRPRETPASSTGATHDIPRRSLPAAGPADVGQLPNCGGPADTMPISSPCHVLAIKSAQQLGSPKPEARERRFSSTRQLPPGASPIPAAALVTDWEPSGLENGSERDGGGEETITGSLSGPLAPIRSLPQNGSAGHVVPSPTRSEAAASFTVAAPEVNNYQNCVTSSQISPAEGTSGGNAGGAAVRSSSAKMRIFKRHSGRRNSAIQAAPDVERVPSGRGRAPRFSPAAGNAAEGPVWRLPSASPHAPGSRGAADAVEHCFIVPRRLCHKCPGFSLAEAVIGEGFSHSSPSCSDCGTEHRVSSALRSTTPRPQDGTALLPTGDVAVSVAEGGMTAVADADVKSKAPATPKAKWLCWGAAAASEGNSVPSLPSYTPIKAAFLPPRVVDISFGEKGIACVTAEGELVVLSCFSGESDESPQDAVLRRERPLLLDVPVEVQFADNAKIARVSSGFSTLSAITTSGMLYELSPGPCSDYGRQDHQRTPTSVPLPRGRVVEVVSGVDFSLALMADHSVIGWGSSLIVSGDESPETTQSLKHVSLPPSRLGVFTHDQRIVHLRAGPCHALAIGSAGAVYSWGSGLNGRLGHGSERRVTRPTRVEQLESHVVIDASCGWSHSAVLTTTGAVLVFGCNEKSQCGLPQFSSGSILVPEMLPLPCAAMSVACSKFNTSVLLLNGDVMVCGQIDASGAGLGHGASLIAPSAVLSSYNVVRLAQRDTIGFALGFQRSQLLLGLGILHGGPPSLFFGGVIPLARGLISMAAGSYFTVFVVEDGSVYSLGNGNHGQLGLEDTSLLPTADIHGLRMPVSSSITRITTFPHGVRVASVAAGFAFVFAITEDQRVFSWGNNSHGQLGHLVVADGKQQPTANQPIEVVTLSEKGVVQIACGSFFAIALTATGAVYAWGIASYCGITSLEPSACCEDRGMFTVADGAGKQSVLCTTPRLVPKLQTSVVAVACGAWHAAALMIDGSVLTWGTGSLGRLGHGTVEDCWIPRRVHGPLHLRPIARIFCGPFNTFAVSADDASLFAWGLNEDCQCGLSSDGAPILEPRRVAGNIISVSCAERHSIAVTCGGNVLFSGVVDVNQERHFAASYDVSGVTLPKPLCSAKAPRRRVIRTVSGTFHSIIAVECNRESSQALTNATKSIEWYHRRLLFEPTGTAASLARCCFEGG